MITGTTRSGFSFEISENLGDNMELLEVLEEMSNKNPYALAKACKIVLGEQQKKALYDHLRTEDGRVPVEGVSDAITDIFEAAGKPGKNS